MHNPGTLPDDELTAACRPDVTAVCEESLDKYRSHNVQQKAALETRPRAQCCMILHTLPQRQIPELVQEMSQNAAYDIHQC